ncbi:unnamed protein product [Pleuronectes platessa]|uniref:Uncharacterized protein n=1 Tax=Pleuronectes platessa TaxID=8262 RepID=A0A9N7Z313_PLEPL|nr:unnamed protein product [Pleuronectes platessa]
MAAAVVDACVQSRHYISSHDSSRQIGAAAAAASLCESLIEISIARGLLVAGSEYKGGQQSHGEAPPFSWSRPNFHLQIEAKNTVRPSCPATFTQVHRSLSLQQDFIES